MILSIQEVLEKEYIKNRDFGNGEGLVEPEGAAIDVRIGEIWEMDVDSDAFLNKETRKTRDYVKVAEFKPGKDTDFILEPMKYYQFKTVEDLDLPEEIMARFNARYNLLANGIMVLAYKADPGFHGKIGIPIVNLSGVPFRLQLGVRFGQFEFHQIKGKGVKYRGQWSGERVFTEDGEEVQV